MSDLMETIKEGLFSEEEEPEKGEFRTGSGYSKPKEKYSFKPVEEEPEDEEEEQEEEEEEKYTYVPKKDYSKALKGGSK